MINTKKKEYIDSKVFEIIKLIKPIDKNILPKGDIPKGSMEELNAVDITDKIIDAPILITSTTYDGETIGVIESYKEKTYGFEEAEYKKLKSFILQIYKEKEIKRLIGYNFLYKTVINWIFESYRKKRKKGKLSFYLQKEFKKTIKSYTIYIPVLYLNISEPFHVGRVLFTFFKNEYLDKLESEFKQENPTINTPFKELREILIGNVYASITITAGAERVKEVGLEECSLAINCLRICSPVMGFPKMKSDFDIEKKSNVVLANNVILQPSDKEYNIILSKRRNAVTYRIDKFEFQNFRSMNLEVYHKFLLEPHGEDEIYKLILNSINSFSEALKDSNLQRRISKIFTIYESLLLKNSTGGILDSLCKYGPKLIFQKIEDRKDLVKILKNLYSIRSAYVHHSKYSKFDIEELKKLQFGLTRLLCNLIRLRKKFKTKDSLINKIDEEIEKAFNLKEAIK